ncbi:hypothetical protein ACIBI9_65200 [Nonomuraea sp. NPDC050451]|uniref:hypothetical protein n=1 Tax=Nonomuraea sp. NPDC050451 TaxID=3364364 RepID=UPI0037ABDBE1
MLGWVDRGGLKRKGRLVMPPVRLGERGRVHRHRRQDRQVPGLSAAAYAFSSAWVRNIRVEVRGLLASGFPVRGPWVSGTAIADPLKLIATVSGRARLIIDGIDVQDTTAPTTVSV